MFHFARIIALSSVIQLLAHPKLKPITNQDPQVEIDPAQHPQDHCANLIKELNSKQSNNELKLEIRSIITRLIVFNNQLDKTTDEFYENFTLDLKKTIENPINQLDLSPDSKIMLIAEAHILLDAINLFCKKKSQDLNISLHTSFKETANMLLMINIFAKTYKMTDPKQFESDGKSLLKQALIEQIKLTSQKIGISLEIGIKTLEKIVLIFYRSFDKNTTTLLDEAFKYLKTPKTYPNR